MKIIHCADLHLDSKLNTSLSKEKAGERRRELTDNFRRLTDYAADNGVSAVLICGDMFDTSRVTAFTRNTVMRAIESNPEITFFLLKGNHDSDCFIDELESIPDNLKLFTNRWQTYEIDGVKIHGAELDQNTSAGLQQNFVPDPADINIVMLHGQEAETISKDKAEIINLRLFANKGIDYLALGHIHEYRRGQLDSMGIYCYPGCLEGRGFDEPGDHGFVLLDIDLDSKLIRDTFVPFAKRKIYVVSVDISSLSDTFSINERIKAALTDSNAGPDDYVKVILSGETDVECEKDIAYLEKSISEIYYASRISDETSLKVDIDSYMLDGTLKGEFVRTVMADPGVPDDRKAQIVRMGLSLFSEVRS